MRAVEKGALNGSGSLSQRGSKDLTLIAVRKLASRMWRMIKVNVIQQTGGEKWQIGKIELAAG